MKSKVLLEWVVTTLVLCLIWEVHLIIKILWRSKPAPTTFEYITNYGYPAEEHTVQSDDGYILSIYRIPRGIKDLEGSNSSRPVVLLQHGTLSCSDAFVSLGPNISISYQLADLGFDVWIGNFRGNRYGVNHVTLTTSDPQFWDFSCDEPALNDLSAVIDYIRNVTGHDRLSYVGHSLGASLALVLSSTKREYNNKFSVIIALAPGVSGLQNGGYSSRSLQARLYMNVLAPLSLKIGHGSMLPYRHELVNALAPFCDPQLFFNFICRQVYGIGGPTSFLDVANLPAITSAVSSSSKKLTTHIGQILATGTFHRYAEPGEDLKQYSMELVDVPTAIFYSDNDYLVHPDSVEKLSKVLPNVITLHKVSNDSFNHLDFLYAEAATNLVYKEIFKILEQFAKNVHS